MTVDTLIELLEGIKGDTEVRTIGVEGHMQDEYETPPHLSLRTVNGVGVLYIVPSDEPGDRL